MLNIVLNLYASKLEYCESLACYQKNEDLSLMC